MSYLLPHEYPSISYLLPHWLWTPLAISSCVPPTSVLHVTCHRELSSMSCHAQTPSLS
jgi:hypothetical protein